MLVRIMQLPVIVHIYKDTAIIGKHVSDQRNLCISKCQFMTFLLHFTLQLNQISCRVLCHFMTFTLKFVLIYDVLVHVLHLNPFEPNPRTAVRVRFSRRNLGPIRHYKTER
jgi:hypothetical protein